ncbi:ATP-binding protein [Caulobacter segnis]|uniref:ATP-binding protein n=1 Tax=Caulobacter segnis TaxID=88688 RepID=UPI001CC1992B|nr:winged helix-turn-helix domain-containing protein [Caulobacter segnis]UAL10192.1 helix-turn-helix transcriptional regulator [Caulobacter segnis]
MMSPLPLPEPAANDVEFRFGGFRLSSAARALWDGDKPVRLGSRAMDILLFLVEQAGQVVSRRALMDHVWQGAHVVEANLTVHIATLRRALGDGADGEGVIINVPGRGYSFIAQVRRLDAGLEPAPDAVFTAPNNLPLQSVRLIGREAIVARLAERLSHDRLVTVVGPGGIGKTSVALALADQSIGRRLHGVWFLDLAPINDGRLLPTALASAMGLIHPPADPLGAVLRALADKDVLVLIDNCEHLLDATAGLVSDLLSASPKVSVLATSREAISMAGETIHRLEPLETPPEAARDAKSVLTYPAARLFLERARAETENFQLTDAAAPTLARICRELDGLPLAIEFAAARAGALGVEALAARLDDRLRLLSLGARDGDPRHRTIAAALEWSYGLLSSAEREVLQRLSVFSGGFTLDAARIVLSDEGLSGDDIDEAVAGLVLKSLVTAEALDREVRFRLLETTRVFALERLNESGRRRALAQSHATYFGGLLQAASTDPAGFDRLAPELDNVRAALGWTLVNQPNLEARLNLAAVSSWFWFSRSLHLECQDWMDRALATIPAGEPPSRAELAVRFALAACAFFTRGLAAEDYSPWLRALDVAVKLDATDYQLDALVALWTYNIRAPRYQLAFEFTDRHRALADATNNLDAQATTHWMMGTNYNHTGQLARAHEHLARFLVDEGPTARFQWLGRTGFDRHSDARGLEGLTYALQGRYAAADASFALSIASARETAKALPVCEALQWAAIGAIVSGAPASIIAKFAQELVVEAERHGLESHAAIGACVQAKHAALEGDLVTAERLFVHGLAGLKASNYGPFNGLFAAEFARLLSLSGRAGDALALLAAQAADEDGVESLMSAEVLRRKAQVLWRAGDRPAARQALEEGLAVAERQGARGLALPLAAAALGVAPEDENAAATLRQLVDALSPAKSRRLDRAKTLLKLSEV